MNIRSLFIRADKHEKQIAELQATVKVLSQRATELESRAAELEARPRGPGRPRKVEDE